MEDGIILVSPPAILRRLGLVQPDVYWKLKKALYGLRCAPKKWGIERDATMTDMKVQLDKKVAVLKQCTTAKGVWKVMVGSDIQGYLIVYVYDALIMAKTRTIEAVMKTFCKQLF